MRRDVKKAPDGLDADWLKLLLKFWGQDRRGKYTLKKWCCPDYGMKVRMRYAGNPKLRHHTCEEAAGQPVFLVLGDVYIANK